MDHVFFSYSFHKNLKPAGLDLYKSLHFKATHTHTNTINYFPFLESNYLEASGDTNIFHNTCCYCHNEI